MKNGRSFRLLLLAFVSCICVVAQAQHKESLRLVIILDASGSMWEQIEGAHKIAVARKALKELLSGLEDDAQVGFIAYGHRSKTDCSDIEILVPLGKIDKNALISSVDSLNPLGKTPITASIKQAMEVVKSSGVHSS